MEVHLISFRRRKRSFITVNSFTSHEMRRARGRSSLPISNLVRHSQAWISSLPCQAGSSHWILQITSVRCIEQAMEVGHGSPSFNDLDLRRGPTVDFMPEFRYRLADSRSR